MKVDWTDDLIAYVRLKWSRGWSAAMIARGLFADKRVSTTRNAVIGKVHRLKLIGPNSDPRPSKMTRKATTVSKGLRKPPPPPKVEKLVKPPVVIPADVWAPLEGSQPLPFDQVRQGGCKWPIGDYPYRFCCEPADGNYCPTHAKVAFRPVPTTAGGLARSLRKYA